MITINGARAMLWDADLGSTEAGKKAGDRAASLVRRAGLEKITASTWPMA